MTICMACRRRTDPNRSFCPNCGSSVFIDSNDRAAMFASAMPAAQTLAATTHGPVSADRPIGQATGQTGQEEPRTQQRRSPQQQARQRIQQAATASAPNAASAVFGFVRLAIFLFVAWKVWGFVREIPEVHSIVEQVQRGESPDFQPAIDKAKSYLNGGNSSSSSDEPSTATPKADELEVPAPPATPPAAAVEVTPAVDPRAPATPRTAADATTPRAIRRVSPVYTPEGARNKVEGTVLLRGLVNADGTVSNISIVKSLDKTYGLDEQAMMALRQWIFEPAQKNGEPVRAFVQVEMTFTLK